jgi:hypothetical protein
MDHEIVIKIKLKEWEEKITLGCFASLVGVLAGCFPLSAMALRVFSREGRQEGVK